MPYNSFANYPMSWKPERSKLSRPVYKSLASELERAIAGGTLPPGTKLPPQRELADYLDINFTTVTRAYSLCRVKGLLYAVTGSGTFVSPNAADAVTISASELPEKTIDLGFVSSFESCNALVREAVEKTAHMDGLERLLDYEEPTGLERHRIAAAQWLRTAGVHTSPDNLAIVSGTQNGLALVLSALFAPGECIAVDTFTYSNFLSLLRLHHLRAVPVHGDSEGMDPDALREACRLNPVKGVFLMPSCANPTTVMISERRKRELAAVIQSAGLVLIEDDIHAFFVSGVSPDYQGPISRLVPDNSVYLSGTSKPICSGLRVAYMVFPVGFRERLLEAIFNVNVKTSSLDAEVITALILSGRARTILERKKALSKEANALFSSYFPDSKAGAPLPFFRWLEISDRRPGAEIERELLSKGLRVYHSDRFLAGNRTGNCFLRIALSTSSQLEKGLRLLSGWAGGGGARL